MRAMTEAEWLACAEPQTILDHLRGRATDRKLRLFACACCRLRWESLTDPASRAAVTVAEKYADGEAPPQELKMVRRAAYTQWRFPNPMAAWHAADARARDGACAAAESVAPRHGAGRDECGMRLQCDFLRCIFGNPFRPVTFSPDWRTSTAVTLARQMYDARDFSAMPILADALQDAGCDNDESLAHCRDPKGVHVRGCWVCDLALGKEQRRRASPSDLYPASGRVMLGAGGACA